MKVVSPAGDFEIKVSDSSVEGEFVVLSGQMGVWDSKIYLTPADIWQFASIFLRPAVILYILKMPFRSLFGGSKANGGKQDGGD
jgi:hypothetical protein